MTAAVWAVRKAKYWLKGCPDILVCTDHMSVVGLIREPWDDNDNEQIQGLLDKHGGYDITFKYVSHKLNRIADGLSRFPVCEGEPEEDFSLAKLDQVFLGESEKDIFLKMLWTC